VPSELLERRPDIAQAERIMAAANALIGVQTAAFYPSFSISAGGGFQSNKISNWLTWPSRFFSLGPSAAFTIFDAGARRSVLANYKAQYEADAAAYRQTVLSAFQQTEDSLAAQRYLAEQLPQQEAAIDAAQKYLDLANVRFRVGLDPYLDVYTAETFSASAATDLYQPAREPNDEQCPTDRGTRRRLESGSTALAEGGRGEVGPYPSVIFSDQRMTSQVSE
jgi:outer membrane protein TolC